MASSDPFTVSWYACMCRGLRARVAGKSRVRCWRPSPGCGVNRRRRAANTLSMRVPPRLREALQLVIQQEEGPHVHGSSRWGRLGDLWLRAVCWSLMCTVRHGPSVIGQQERASIEEDTGSCRPPDPPTPTRLRGAMSAGCVRLVACGARLAARRAKCLQACAIDSLAGGQRQRVALRLVARCRNDDGSGYGSLREVRNFEEVRKALVAESVHVWVYESDSAVGLARGELFGRWRFGSAAGVSVGVMVWLRREQHVVRLVVSDPASGLDGCWQASADVAPWFRYVVGAPKKKSQRGAHLNSRQTTTEVVAAAGGPSVPERRAPTLSQLSDGLVDLAPQRAVPRLTGLNDSSGDDESDVPLRPRPEVPRAPRVLGVSNTSDEGKATAAPQRSIPRAPRLLGLNVSSDDEEGVAAPPLMRSSRVHESASDASVDGRRSARRRVPRRKSARFVAAMCDPNDALEFQPAAVDATRCQALMWNHGYGKLQCSRKPRGACGVCAGHANLPHGRVRGAIPQRKLDEFRDFALKPVKKASDQWYARHLMWAYAIKQVPDLEYLNELQDETEEDETKWVYRLDDEMYERCLAKINMHLKAHPYLKKRYEIDVGVRMRDDRVGVRGRYGAPRELYNGRGGGRVFKWYTRTVFNHYLARMGASEESCTERQCMVALRRMS